MGTPSLADLDTELLTLFEERLQAGRVFEVMGAFNRSLRISRSTMSPKDWASFIASSIAEHPLQELLRRSPFSGRASSRPRGYAGDAVMIDMIYGDHSALSQVDRLSADIARYELTTQSCAAVRARRRYAERRVAAYGSTMGGARVLSLACGHLREIRATSLDSFSQNFEIVALDQDATSLADVSSRLPDSRIQLINASVVSLLSGSVDLGTFDFIYTLGLYDYLEQRVARILTKRLLRMLRPQGELLIGNFAPGLLDVGYMEAIMDWWLVYRDEELLHDLLASVSNSDYASAHLFRDSHEAVVYLNISK